MSFYARDNFRSDAEFVWFNRSIYQDVCVSIKPQLAFYDDKIGISKDGRAMVHDGILYILTRLGEKDEIEPIVLRDRLGPVNVKVRYVFYRVGSRSDLVFGVSPVSLLYFKFFYKQNGKLAFAHVGYLGAEFRRSG